MAIKEITVEPKGDLSIYASIVWTSLTLPAEIMESIKTETSRNFIVYIKISF